MASEVSTKPGNLILMGLPTKTDMYSGDFLTMAHQLQKPTNCTLGHVRVPGKPVDEARNICVEEAQKAGAKYLFFVDDDVLVPRDALLRLLDHRLPIVTGVYWTKTMPPEPVIYRADKPGGYRDWKFGDVIKVDYCGAGCLLIDMTVFDNWPEGVPYFKYAAGLDAVPNVGSMGEDVWFCHYAREAGFDIIADTGIMCAHRDNTSKTNFFYDPRFDTGVWRKDDDAQVRYIPTAAESLSEQRPEPKQIEKLCWGYGRELKDFTEAGTDVPDAIRFGFTGVREIRIRRLLEFKTEPAGVALLGAVSSIIDEGTIEIEVPDVIGRTSKLRAKSTARDLEDAIGGANKRYTGIYTSQSLSDLVRLVGFEDVKTRKDSGNIVLTARKVKE